MNSIKIIGLIYWIVSTIISVRWLIRNPRYMSDDSITNTVSLGTILGYTVLSIIFGPFAVIFAILDSIKFKRK